MSDWGSFESKRLAQVNGCFQWLFFGLVFVSFCVLLLLGGITAFGFDTGEFQNGELDLITLADENDTVEYSSHEVAGSDLNTGQGRDSNQLTRHTDTPQFNTADTSTASTSTVHWVEPPPDEVVEDTVFSVTLGGEGQDEVCLVDWGLIDDAIGCESVNGEFTETFTVDVADDLDNGDSTLYAGVDDTGSITYSPEDETSHEEVEVIPDPVHWEEPPPSEVEKNSTFSVDVSGERAGEVCLIQKERDIGEPIGCEAIDGEYTVTFTIDVEDDLNNENAELYAEVSDGGYTTSEATIHVVEESSLIVEVLAAILFALIVALIVGVAIVITGTYLGTLPSIPILTPLNPFHSTFPDQLEIIRKYRKYNSVLDTELSVTEQSLQNILSPDSISQRLNLSQREKTWRRIKDAAPVYERYIEFLQHHRIKVNSKLLEQLLASFDPHSYALSSHGKSLQYEQDKDLLLSFIESLEWFHQNEPDVAFNTEGAYWALVPTLPRTIDELRNSTSTIEQRKDTIRQFTNQCKELDSLTSSNCNLHVKNKHELINTHLSEIQTPEDVHTFEQTISQLRTICELTQDTDSTQGDVIATLTTEAIRNPEQNEAAVSAYRTLHDLQKVNDEYLENQLSQIEEKLCTAIYSNEETNATIETLHQLLDNISVLVEFIDTNKSHPLVDETEWKAEIKKALEEEYSKRLQPYIKQVNRMEGTFWEKDDLFSFDWEEFEHLVGTLYEAEGYNVEVTDGTHDFGVDVWAENGQKTAIQVKQFGDGNTVGREPLQKLASTLAKGTADRIVVVTSSSFTKTAKDYAQDFGPEIELVNGQDLLRRLIQAEVPSPP